VQEEEDDLMVLLFPIMALNLSDEASQKFIEENDIVGELAESRQYSDAFLSEVVTGVYAY
jgi:hypothetical protein